MPAQTTAKPEVAMEKKQPLSTAPVAATATNSANANATTGGNTARHRRNTRRYGGEPKLRRRTYANYEAPEHKTKS